MRRLDLDLLPSRGPVWGWLLLGLAVAAVADLGASWKSAEDEAQARTVRARPEVAAKGDRESPEALRDAERVARSLTLPWDDLFRNVEEASDERVALLALQPDAGKREVAIAGEAKDYESLLAFVARLDRREGLRHVHLVRHEMREDDPQRPLAFTLVAGWESKR